MSCGVCLGVATGLQGLKNGTELNEDTEHTEGWRIVGWEAVVRRGSTSLPPGFRRLSAEFKWLVMNGWSGFKGVNGEKAEG
jgi:hypothetical protein